MLILITKAAMHFTQLHVVITEFVVHAFNILSRAYLPVIEFNSKELRVQLLLTY